ncbi:hypothetical protein B1A_03061, partial [mine drainage metagenome]
DPTLQRFTVSPANLTEGSPTSIAVSVVGGTLPYQYSYSGLPSGCPAADRPTLSCTPQQNGTFRIDVTVVDHAGWALQGSAILIVHPQPTISGLIFSPSAIDLGMTTEIQVTLSGGTPPYVFDYSGPPPRLRQRRQPGSVLQADRRGLQPHHGPGHRRLWVERHRFRWVGGQPRSDHQWLCREPFPGRCRDPRG